MNMDWWCRSDDRREKKLTLHICPFLASFLQSFVVKPDLSIREVQRVVVTEGQIYLAALPRAVQDFLRCAWIS